jgi:hypothetical protein
MRKLFLIAWALGAPCVAADIARAATAHMTYTAASTTHAVGSDTALSDSDWSRGLIADATNAFEDLTTRAEAPLGTDAYVLYDQKNLYIAFKVQQSGVPIVANQTTNNVGFGLDDFVGIGIDTSGNGATVYYFETTPRGTRYQQASESTRYTPAWDATTHVDKGGLPS